MARNVLAKRRNNTTVRNNSRKRPKRTNSRKRPKRTNSRKRPKRTNSKKRPKRTNSKKRTTKTYRGGAQAESDGWEEDGWRYEGRGDDGGWEEDEASGRVYDEQPNFFFSSGVSNGDALVSELRELVENGAVDADTLVWMDGMVAWGALSE
jgi:hypothetical protein